MILPCARPSVIRFNALATSWSSYVLSMTGVTLPDSMSSLSATRSAEFSDDVSVPSFWLTTSDNKSARIWRSNPPSHRPSVSPPTMTSLPVVVRARRSCDSRTVAADIEDYVVATLPIGEVLARVVNDVISTDGSDHVHLRGAANTRDFSTERLGDLHREGPHASRRADDEHLLPRLYLRLVAHGLQRGDRRDGAGRSRLVREVRGLGCELAHRDPRRIRRRSHRNCRRPRRPAQTRSRSCRRTRPSRQDCGPDSEPSARGARSPRLG